MKKLRIGIVGLGRVASSTHIPVIRTLDDVEIVAAVEKNQERAERVKKLFTIPKLYDQYEKRYASEKLDGVYVLLPNHLHKEACKKALETGIHVLCEKPMGISAEEAEDLTEIAEKKGLVLMPGYKRRYAANFMKAKKVIEEGTLGKVIHVEGTFVTPGPYISWDPKSEWYLDKRWHGVIYDSCCHLVDVLIYLLPYKFGNIRTLFHKGFIGYDTPTNVVCLFEMEEGILGQLTTGWRASADVFSLSIHGTAGSISVSPEFFSYVNPGTDPVDKIKAHFENGCRGCLSLIRKVRDKIQGKNFYAEDLLQARAFCNAIRGYEKPFIDGRDAIKVHRFLQHMTA
jgi:predicted dehydrogenase